jgi:hypothetical protein
MKSLSKIPSYIFHPLIMPSLGLLLILNSGTYLSLLDPSAKRAILFVMALGTLFFPIMMMPVLYYRKLISSFEDRTREGRIVPMVIILVLFSITFVYFLRLPLSRVIHGYILSVSLVLLVLLLVSLRYRICPHMAALGGMSALIISLILLFETPLQGVLILSILAAGITGSTRIHAGIQRPGEVFSGFILGFAVVFGTILLY